MPTSSDEIDEREERRRLSYALTALLAIITIELRKEERRAHAGPTPAGSSPEELERRRAAVELARHFDRAS